MVRRKQALVVRSDAELVEVTLHGPKSILPGPMSVPANIHHTWMDLLRSELDIAVAPNSSISVCTLDYNPAREGQGWTWKLTDKIGEFVDRCGRNSNKLEARLWHPEAITYSLTEPSINSAASGNVSFEPPLLSGEPSIVISTQGPAYISPLASGPPQINDFAAPGPSNPGPSSAVNLPRFQPVFTANKDPRTFKKPTSKDFRKNGKQSQKSGSVLKRRHEPEVDELWVPPRHVNGSRGAGNPNKMPRKETVSSPTRPVARAVSRARAAVEADAPQIERVVVKDEMNYDFIDESSEINGGQHNQNEELAGNGERGNEEVDSNASDNEGDDDLDNVSLMTSVEQEQRDLEREGIVVEDVLGPVITQSSRFSNAFWLRVRNEIRKLRESNEWRRNVYRAPLCSYLVQELVKEQN